MATNHADPDEIEERLNMNGAGAGVIPESPKHKMTASNIQMTQSAIVREEDKLEKEEDDEEGLMEVERTIAFTDAAVAIAMTLLILPLMEQSGTDEPVEGDTGDWYKEHAVAIIAFVASFLISASFWKDHNALFSRLEHMTFRLVSFNFLWMLAVTFIPVSTSLIYHLTKGTNGEGGGEEEGGDRFLEEMEATMEGSGEEESTELGSSEGSSDDDTDRLVYFQYFANLLIVRVLYFCMVLEARFNPQLWNHHRGPKKRILLESFLHVLLLTLACGLSQTKMEIYSIAVVILVYPFMWILEMYFPYLKGRFGDHRS